jgi:dextranase
MAVTLIPDRAGYAPGDEVVVELDRPAEQHGELVVTHLAEAVRRVPVVTGDTRVGLGTFPRGGYGVTLGSSTTAFDVLDDPFERPRYGFVVRLTDPDRTAAVTRTFRRLHLTAALLYDWAYRHATLLPPERFYVDPLGAERDLEVVNDLSRSLDAAGTLPLGYSAVYAIGSAELDDWPGSVLLRSDGEPYRLGDDFLVLVDPIEPTWLAHYLDELDGVLAATALRGFHLDQYGWPKFARRSDGERVDLAESFRVLLDAVRERMPTARFMFNNVNDFGTAETATTGQDASYIEVWPPHSTLDDLALLAARTRAYRPEHPPIFAAYLSCFDAEPEERAVAAAELVMATVFAAGATHLLLGEDGAALTDPYYVRHHELTPAALDALVPWYDFAVRYGDLLYDSGAIDVTEFYTGGINGDVVVEADIPISTKADAGSLWTRVVRTDAGLVVHLVDLAAQSETAWDAGKTPSEPRSGVRVGLAPVAPGSPVRFATVDAPDLVELASSGVGTSEQSDALTAAQSSAWFELPPFRVWGMLVIPTESLG